MKYLFVALAGISVFLFPVCSCLTGETTARILGASSEALVFLECRAVSETEIDFQFSLPVKIVSLRFSPDMEIDSLEEGSTVRVHFAQSPGIGERLTADLLAEDDEGNTINVLVPFRTRNTRVPALQINEMRTEYASSSSRSEFIEFKILKAGNLGALRVFIAGNYKNPLVYEFSPVEVSETEYLVLHLRSIGGDICRDEYGKDLNESGGAEAVAGVRDFWVPGLTKLLHKTDAVYVLDQDDQALDGVMLSEEALAWWSKEYFAEAADFLFKQGAWKSAEGKISGPGESVDTSSVKTAATKSISRNEKTEDSNTAADWYVTAASGATPGKPNKL